MSGFDFGALDTFEKEEASKKSSIFRMQEVEMGGEQTFRLLVNREKFPESKGILPFKQVITYWINNKPYTSLKTFGEDCPLEEEFWAAKKSKDPELEALIAYQNNNFTREVTYYYPCLLLNTSGDSPVVEGGKAKVISVSNSVMTKINKLITQDEAIKVCGPASIASRDTGFNLVLSKEKGKDKKINYDIQRALVPTDLSDKEYDIYYNNPMGIMEYLEKFRKKPSELRSVIRHYLYGEEIVLEDESTDGTILDTLKNVNLEDK